MKNKSFKTILLSLIIAIIGFASLVSIPPTYAKSDDPVCTQQGVPQEVKEAAGCPGTAYAGTDKLPNAITTILNSIIAVCGLVAVVFIIIGGVNYMTSSGDAGKVKKAKDTILYACIGLIICALAFAIVNWVINGVLK